MRTIWYFGKYVYIDLWQWGAPLGVRYSKGLLDNRSVEVSVLCVHFVIEVA